MARVPFTRVPIEKFNFRVPSIQHFLHLVAYVTWVAAVIYQGITSRSLTPQEDPLKQYGAFITYFSIGVRLLAMLIIPQMAAMTLGLILYDIRQPRSIELKCSLVESPLLCVRIVTRGLYPTLINQNLRNHLEVANKVGLTNFVLEVVTDNQIKLDVTEHQMKYVKQTVVPDSYTSKNGSLNKARALQYCLEDGVNTLRESDWILHLDEETRLTADSLKGVLNFINNSGGHTFGQGVILYGAQPELPFSSGWTRLQHRLCTVADSVRVADDLGKHRAQFKLLHRPYFGIKGSYVVSKFSAEHEVGWDFGPPGSKTEDAWMCLVAIEKGFTFDFVEGDMLERSPFTFTDFFKQRRRWMQGIFMVAATPTLKLRTRLLIGSGLAVWLTLPLATTGVILQILYPFDLPYLWMDLVMGWVSATALYQYFIGYVRQFNVHRMSWLRLLLAAPEVLVASTVSLVAENLAVILMWFGDWYAFYIVQKEVQGMDDDSGYSDKVNNDTLQTLPAKVLDLVNRKEVTNTLNNNIFGKQSEQLTISV